MKRYFFLFKMFFSTIILAQTHFSNQMVMLEGEYGTIHATKDNLLNQLEQVPCSNQRGVLETIRAEVLKDSYLLINENGTFVTNLKTKKTKKLPNNMFVYFTNACNGFANLLENNRANIYNKLTGLWANNYTKRTGPNPNQTTYVLDESYPFLSINQHAENNDDNMFEEMNHQESNQKIWDRPDDRFTPKNQAEKKYQPIIISNYDDFIPIPAPKNTHPVYIKSERDPNGFQTILIEQEELKNGKKIIRKILSN